LERKLHPSRDRASYVPSLGRTHARQVVPGRSDGRCRCNITNGSQGADNKSNHVLVMMVTSMAPGAGAQELLHQKLRPSFSSAQPQDKVRFQLHEPAISSRRRHPDLRELCQNWEQDQWAPVASMGVISPRTRTWIDTRIRTRKQSGLRPGTGDLPRKGNLPRPAGNSKIRTNDYWYGRTRPRSR